MAIIRIAQPSNAEALLSLARGFATSFVVEPMAFEIAFAELLSSPSSYLAVAIADRDLVGYALGFNHYT